MQATSRLRATFGRGFVADPDVRIGVAELAGEPVAAAMAMRTGSVLGVYAVATIERARRRGLGRAVTRAVIDAGVDAWQSRMAILQSSEMGRPLYRSMGYEPVEVDIGEFQKLEGCVTCLSVRLRS